MSDFFEPVFGPRHNKRNPDAPDAPQANPHPIYVRLNRWAKQGVLERVLTELQRDQLDGLDCSTLSLDSTIIKLHPDASGARRRGRQSIGRSRCGWTTKLHALVADEPTPLSLALSPGQDGDAPWGCALLLRLGARADHPALLMDPRL